MSDEEFRHINLKVPIEMHKLIRIWGIQNGLKSKEAYQTILQQWYDKKAIPEFGQKIFVGDVEAIYLGHPCWEQNPTHPQSTHYIKYQDSRPDDEKETSAILKHIRWMGPDCEGGKTIG